MAKIEREYNIPLRSEFRKVPIYKRAKKAMTAVRSFLVKHMKSEDVKLGRHLNEKVWERGIKNPPHHIAVKVTKDENGTVYAELKDAPVERKSKIELKKEKVEAKKAAAVKAKAAEVKKKADEAKKAAAAKKAETKATETKAPAAKEKVAEKKSEDKKE